MRRIQQFVKEKFYNFKKEKNFVKKKEKSDLLPIIFRLAFKIWALAVQIMLAHKDLHVRQLHKPRAAYMQHAVYTTAYISTS